MVVVAVAVAVLVVVLVVVVVVLLLPAVMTINIACNMFTCSLILSTVNSHSW